MNKFFYLHIKKAAGTSIKNALQPEYVKSPADLCTFIGSPREEYNDILNTWRVPLGEYDYKRALFSKKFLYDKNEFEEMVKFTVIRNPYSRAVSCWKYLYGAAKRPQNLPKRLSFSLFLKSLENNWRTKKNRHVATHTAPFWDDITDFNGKILIDQIIKIEELEKKSDFFKKILKRDLDIPHLNRTRGHTEYRRFYTKETKQIVYNLYKNDIENFGYKF